jgi:CubicO group peptidase (beta-lactamase class C family)
LLAILFSGASTDVLAATQGPPAFEWPICLPEEAGMDSEALSEMFDYVRQHEIRVHSVQIVRNGRLALDAYFYPFAAGMRHDVASVTKSITSTLVGLAIQKKNLSGVQQPVMNLFADRAVRNLDERKRSITLENLLTMQAGWDCGFEPGEARLGEMRRSSDWLQFMLDLPMVATPGTRFAYCSGNAHLLSIILSRAAGTNAMAFARRELFEPLGIRDVSWPTDPEGNNHGWGDLQLLPRDMAKVGQLFLQGGRWGARQILAESWVRTATSNQVDRTVNQDHYGYAWWVKGKDFPGMFEAVGRGGQRITVWPAKEIVVVFTGGEFEPGDLGKFILKALQSDQGLPANPAAAAKLKARMTAAAGPPPRRPVEKFPATAARISGKTITLSTNSPRLKELTLKFKEASEAETEILLDKTREHFKVGLDGVERFSGSKLVNLPAAAQGRWTSDHTFLLQLDLVGGINCYEIKLTFEDRSERVEISLSERTGLNNERFTGVLH